MTVANEKDLLIEWLRSSKCWDVGGVFGEVKDECEGCG
jgi:hypothetical protein